MRIQEQWSKCGALWRQLDLSTQLKFNDPEFLATLPNPCLTQTNPNAPKLAGTLTSNVPESAGLLTSIVPKLAGPPTNTGKGNVQPRKLAKPRTFDISRWADKIFHNPTNLSVTHSIQEYLVVTYPHKKGRAMMTVGSPMGKAFLDMFAIDPNPCGEFLEFVKGQAALKKISGCDPPLPKKARKCKADMRPDGPSKYNLGNSELNRKSLSNQLGHAIFKATNGQWRNDWPGTKTKWRLNELGVQLQVKRNNDGASGKGWVELLGRRTDGPDVIGNVLDNDNDNRRCVKVGPVPPRGYVPPSKVRTQSAGQKKMKKPVTSNTDTTKTKPNKRVKTNQGKSVCSTVNEDESEGSADVNNATVSKTLDNTKASTAEGMDSTLKEITPSSRPGQRPAAVQLNTTTTYKPQLRKVQNKKKKVVILSSEESEAEETPGELSESKDTPAKSSNEDSDAEEHSDAQEDSNLWINHQDALRQPVASDSSRPPRPSTPASDTSSNISLNALKKRRKIQLKQACNKAVPQ
ncbi:hypothetical protein PCASD_22616 [Puccinia coronata f. sp. avenae]|uniref:Uncharacterized protein n=1 Tax=Puccinia coronata f. sp. avenae TaxID=200324 RepID=A0A2N5S9F7_9BASI|nr:hypothetical protein PCASD_22616 [Puccinia coronata f. sp. avenae]